MGNLVTRPVVLIDGGHLLAGVGRSLGLGPRRVDGRLDIVSLVGRVLRLLPDGPLAETHWFDGALPDRPTTDLARLEACERITVITSPVRGGRQRYLEAMVLRDALALAADGTRCYLVGDPRRHAVTLELFAAAGSPATIIGVAGGESTPAPRLWLRRADLADLFWETEGARGRRRASSAGYVPPRVHATQARPGPPALGGRV